MNYIVFFGKASTAQITVSDGEQYFHPAWGPALRARLVFRPVCLHHSSGDSAVAYSVQAFTTSAPSSCWCAERVWDKLLSRNWRSCISGTFFFPTKFQNFASADIGG